MAPPDDPGPSEPVVGPREARLRARLGPHGGPLLVVASMALVVLLGVVITVVGADPGSGPRKDVSTILGTLPVDPRVPEGGIPVQFDSTPATAPGSSTTTTTAAGSVPSTPSAKPFTELDGFDTAGRPVPPTPDGQAWTASAGEWSTAGGRLRGTPAAGSVAALTVPAPAGPVAFGATAATLGPQSGVVLHWQDDRNYLALLAVPAAGGWRFVSTVDGQQAFLKQVPLTSTKPGVTITVRIDGAAVTVSAGAKPTTFSLPAGADPGGSRVGLVALPGSRGTTWDATYLEAG